MWNPAQVRRLGVRMTSGAWDVWMGIMIPSKRRWKMTRKGMSTLEPVNTLWWRKMAIQIVDFPMKNGDFPLQHVSSPEGKPWMIMFRMFHLTSVKWNVERVERVEHVEHHFKGLTCHPNSSHAQVPSPSATSRSISNNSWSSRLWRWPDGL